MSPRARTRSRGAPGALRALPALFALLLACPGADEPGAELSDPPAEPAAGPSAGAVGYLLTPLQPSAVQPLRETRSSAEPHRFVEVEVQRVLNPQRVPLSFDVHYLPQPDERVLLGSFSLFPPDRPGSFIVATRDQVGEQGEFEITLRTLEPAAPGAALEVRIGPLRLR